MFCGEKRDEEITYQARRRQAPSDPARRSTRDTGFNKTRIFPTTDLSSRPESNLIQTLIVSYWFCKYTLL